MSYPQLFALRAAFEDIKNLVANKSGFIEADNTISVKQEYAQPIVLDNIGKGNKWLALKLEAFNDTDEQGITHAVPGVSIQISSANFKSVLSVEEFLTVYTIIKDLDLTSLQCQLSIAFLQANEQPMMQNQNNYNQNYNNNYNGGYNNGGYNGNYQNRNYGNGNYNGGNNNRRL